MGWEGPASASPPRRPGLPSSPAAGPRLGTHVRGCGRREAPARAWPRTRLGGAAPPALSGPVFPCDGLWALGHPSPGPSDLRSGPGWGPARHPSCTVPSQRVDAARAHGSPRRAPLLGRAGLCGLWPSPPRAPATSLRHSGPKNLGAPMMQQRGGGPGHPGDVIYVPDQRSVQRGQSGVRPNADPAALCGPGPACSPPLQSPCNPLAGDLVQKGDSLLQVPALRSPLSGICFQLGPLWASHADCRRQVPPGSS